MFHLFDWTLMGQVRQSANSLLDRKRFGLQMKVITFANFGQLTLDGRVELLMLTGIKRLQRGMCKRFCDTPQAHLTATDGGNAEKCLEHFWPCGLNDSIPPVDSHSRACTGYLISSIELYRYPFRQHPCGQRVAGNAE